MKFQINNLSAKINKKTILNDFSLDINEGEVHLLMGPNGVGKSTLSRVIMNDKNYSVTNGDILVDNKSILKLSTDERSRLGIFLAMQYPTEIEGISNQDFIRTAMSTKNNNRIGLYDFILKCEKATEELKMDKNLIHRDLNIGFSGGEKKKNEVLQIKLLEPSLIILDELDSGLDVDSFKIVNQNILDYKKQYPKISILIITHHATIIKYLKPDYVHIMNKGTIIKTGDYKLALDIEKNGYNKYLDLTNIVYMDQDYE